MDERLAKVLSDYDYDTQMRQEIRKAYILIKKGLYDVESIEETSGIFEKVKLKDPRVPIPIPADGGEYMIRISDSKICVVKRNDATSVEATTQRYLIKTPIMIDDEDYEKIANFDDTSPHRVVPMLRAFAIILYALSGFVFFLGIASSEGKPFHVISALFATFSTVLLGLVVHGFSIVVGNTIEINDKL